MITINDLTPLEFVVVILHTFTATGYMVLAYQIYKRKKYLRWNKHIYPTMMFGALVTSLALFWLLSTAYFTDVQPDIAWMMIFIFIGIAAIGYAVGAEAVRLTYKYDMMREQEHEINRLNDHIKHLEKPMKAIILLITMLALLGCGSRKVEIEKLKNERTELVENYEKRVSDLNAKISEVESREVVTKQQLSEKQAEIVSLKKERSELIEKLSKEDSEDIVIKNATGTVKMTDAKGNVYEIPAGQGTEIMKTSMSKLSQELNQVTEKANYYENKLNEKVKELFARDNALKKKETEIEAQNALIAKLKTEIEEKDSELKKQTHREAYPIWLWIGIGMVGMFLLQLFWKAYSPKLPKIF